MTLRHSINGFGKAIGGLLLALLLLVPSLGPFVVLAYGASECGKNCCRTTKSCCCRKGGGSISAGLVISARSCPPGCGQAQATLNTIQSLFTSTLQILYDVRAVYSLSCLITAITASLLFAFALFGRPPPSAASHCV